MNETWFLLDGRVGSLLGWVRLVAKLVGWVAALFCRVLKGGLSTGTGQLGKPKDSVWEDWGSP